MDRFYVSPDDAWVDAVGVAPELCTGEDDVYEVVIPVKEDTDLHVTWDPSDRSVRLRVIGGGRTVVDVYREQSRRLLAFAHRDKRAVVVEYGGSKTEGHLEVLLAPELGWTDTLLRR